MGFKAITLLSLGHINIDSLDVQKLNNVTALIL